MAEQHLRYLAVLVCLYSFFEFFPKRVLWKPSEAQTSAAAAKEATALLFILLVGTSGLLSVTLAIGLVLVAVVHFFLAVIEKRHSTGLFALESFLLKQAVVGILLCVLCALPYRWRSMSGMLRAKMQCFPDFGKSADVLRDRLALILSVAAAYLFMIDGGTRIVRGILDKFSGLYWKVLKVLNEEGQ